jgi:colicin import membrane protein
MFYAARHYSLPFLLALSLHAAAAWALYQGWNPEKELLNVVKPQTVMASLIVLKPKAKAAPPPKVDVAQKQREAERAKQAKADQAKVRKEAKSKAEQQAAAKAREEQRLAERARQAQADKQTAAELARQERLARLSELAATSLQQAIADESVDLQAGSEEQVLRSYHAAIYELVRTNWSRPPSSRTGMQARLQVELIPTGEVVAVTIIDSSGNAAFDRSAEHAVRLAKRFEVPQENALFERHFRRFYILFQPEDLLR